jgi:hypothetical protein
VQDVGDAEPGPSELADPWSLVATDGGPVQLDYVVDAILGAAR